MAYTETKTTMSTVTKRVVEEKSRANSNQPPGRLMSQLTGMYHPVLDYGNNGEILVKIGFKAEDLKRFMSEVNGYKGNHLFWGTSFSRADVKELNQLISICMFFDHQGVEGKGIGYFIDPNAHTIQELFDAMSYDLGVNFLTEWGDKLALSQDLDEAISGVGLNLPPKFFLAPTAEMIKSLHLPERFEMLREIMLAASGADVVTFGDWRIAVDRIVLSRELIKPEYNLSGQNNIEVIDFNSLMEGGSPVALQELADTIKQSTRDYMETVRIISNPRYKEIPFSLNDDSVSKAQQESMNPILEEGEEFETIRPPIMLRLACPDGSRIGVDTNFSPVGLGGSVLSEANRIYAEEVISKIRDLSIQEAMRSFPVQPSGVGYMLSVNLMIKNTQDTGAPQAVFIMDDYEESNGPGAANMHIASQGVMVPFCIPKGLVGGISSEGEESFDVNPDSLLFAAVDSDSTKRLAYNAYINAHILETDYAFANVGVVIDAKGQVVSSPELVTARNLIVHLTKILQEESYIGEDQNQYSEVAEIRDIVATEVTMRKLILSLVTLQPKDVIHKLGINLNAIDQTEVIETKIKLLNVVINLISAVDSEMAAELTSLRGRILKLKAITRRGFELSEEVERAFTANGRKQYFINNVIARMSLARESQLEVDGYLHAIRTSSTEDVWKNKASEFGADLNNQLIEKIKNKLRNARPRIWHEANSLSSQLDSNIRSFGCLGRVSAVLKNPSLISKIRPISNDDINQTILKLFGYEIAVDIADLDNACEQINKFKSQIPDWEALLAKAQQELPGEILQLFNRLCNDLGLPKLEVVTGTNGRLTDEFTRRVGQIHTIIHNFGKKFDLGEINIGNRIRFAEMTITDPELSRRWDEFVISRPEAVLNEEEFKVRWEDLNKASGIWEQIAQVNSIYDVINDEVVEPKHRLVKEITTIFDQLSPRLDSIYLIAWRSVVEKILRDGFMLADEV